MRGRSGSASAKTKNWVACILTFGPQNCSHSFRTMIFMESKRQGLGGEGSRIYHPRWNSILLTKLKSSRVVWSLDFEHKFANADLSVARPKFLFANVLMPYYCCSSGSVLNLATVLGALGSGSALWGVWRVSVYESIEMEQYEACSQRGHKNTPRTALANQFLQGDGSSIG